MDHYGKKVISVVTLIIAVIIFIQTNFLTIVLFNLNSDSKKTVAITNEEQTNEDLNDEWKLIIPKINIEGSIKEGTTGEIINDYIGHFEQTAELNGNIGLIAGSTGYKENYFANLEQLNEGDVIIYVKENVKKEYKVTTNTVISQTDWSYLSNSEENKITLITGILTEPQNRRCVQAVQINI